MIAPRGLNLIELDRRASTADAPYAIITADCSSPQEIDDGVFVEALPANQETYRVGVCVADTSGLYDNGDIFRQAMKTVAARYWELPDGERGYDPMIDQGLIRDLEFTRGHVRNALVVSFIVGEHQPPSEVDITFGKVEVTRNMDYKRFGERCRAQQPDERFGRASAFIIRHLKYTSGGDYDGTLVAASDNPDPDVIYRRLVNGSSKNAWFRGSRLNEAYMVAANHLVGLQMAIEGRPAVYRVHDPSDEKYLEFLPPDVATYSRTPGVHAGLNLDSYCRVTSPLRRLEDFIMSYQLKQRYLGRAATLRDVSDVAAAVQHLNRHVIQEVSKGPLRLNRHDTLGKIGIKAEKLALGSSNVVALRRDISEVATA